jgi:hypothetical protein
MLLVVITPLIIPVTATEPNQLNNLQFGAPLPFIQQEILLEPPEKWFPNRMTIMNPWEHPTKIIWANFITSTVIISVGLIVLSRALARYLR